MAEALEPVAKPVREYLFNEENAKLMSQKSWEARRKQRIEDAKRLAELEEIEKAFNTIVAKQNPEQRQSEPVKPSYQAESLVRVRGHIEATQECLTNALQSPKVDAQAVDRLVNALTRLREQERILDGRPLPGSMRPEKPSRKPSRTTGPLYSDPDPTPAPLEPAKLWSDYC